MWPHKPSSHWLIMPIPSAAIPLHSRSVVWCGNRELSLYGSQLLNSVFSHQCRGSQCSCHSAAGGTITTSTSHWNPWIFSKLFEIEFSQSWKSSPCEGCPAHCCKTKQSLPWLLSAGNPFDFTMPRQKLWNPKRSLPAVRTCQTKSSVSSAWEEDDKSVYQMLIVSRKEDRRESWNYDAFVLLRTNLSRRQLCNSVSKLIPETPGLQATLSSCFSAFIKYQ